MTRNAVLAILATLLTACVLNGCGKEGVAPTALDREGLIIWLLSKNRAQIPSLSPHPRGTGQYDWADAEVRLTPGAIIVVPFSQEDPNYDLELHMFYADGRFIGRATYCEVADVTGDGVRDLVVAEPALGLWSKRYSVYPLGLDCKPILGFAIAETRGRGVPRMGVADFDEDGVAEVIVVQTLESMAGEDWFNDTEWEAFRKTHGGTGPMTAVWSFKSGIAKPLLVFAGDYEWQIARPRGLIVAKEPYDNGSGIPERARRYPSGPSWFTVMFDKEVGQFVIPTQHPKTGPVFLRNCVIAGKECVETKE